MDVTSPRTLRSPVKILSDNNLALTPDRQHEIAEGMVALLMAKEGARYMAAVVREGFIQLGSPAWAEIFLKEDIYVAEFKSGTLVYFIAHCRR